MTTDDARLEEFLDALDRHGGNLEAWPKQSRALAEETLAQSPMARTQLESMRRAEAALVLTRADRDWCAGDVAAYAMRHAQERPYAMVVRRLSFAAAGTFALILGIFVGARPMPADDTTRVLTSALTQTDGRDVW